MLGRGSELASDQTSGVRHISFLILGIDTGIAQLGIGEGDQLTRVTGIREHLLVAGHPGVENHFANQLPRLPHASPSNTVPSASTSTAGTVGVAGHGQQTLGGSIRFLIVPPAVQSLTQALQTLPRPPFCETAQSPLGTGLEVHLHTCDPEH